jgi:hypothetical protein
LQYLHSTFPPYLSCLQNNLPENNVEPVPAKSEPVQLCVFLLWFLPNMSCLQNNLPENNVEQFLPNLSCPQNNPLENNVEDLAGTRFTLFSSGLFWDQFLLDLRSFFGLFEVQIDVLLFLSQVGFTQNHPIFMRN